MADDLHPPNLAPNQDIQRQLRDAMVLLLSVRGSLADMLAELSAGNPGPLREIAPKQSELETALRRAFDTEQKFNDWYAKFAKGTADDTLDYDAIRDEIGCRLARLNPCCDAG
ncbi:hypothetical protein [Ketogulonicigenium vulgare]|uniref:Uncharacterized protein n=1 Tax=Ketogulonicigenium vulgare (strain WSH-001) TaxID=759362 RepID=F9Y452_KETVW|nr:hypothetical protein [Ketogulonicigenium vulgare]ADO42292.1 conserved hypothetical protein [Ketogulonicigenium vulgare Y25]AEM40488.1 hypothetical protein KVU_0649 [Ketogulonicigenium vulgare WSH-001]ALJ80672.1 hypothetical protein KVH_05455 [Ketogulonicigenium vulgare]ANW33481.1 hypothetical protein KvSKV_05425 [Ketogulonicigenium vulgare]AOZ54204.1 hypothetical protein KVC_1187 [Ketogulonicigenium vulgare]